MYKNLSVRLEIIDEKFQSADRSLLLLSKAEQNITDRNTINAIDGIHKKIDNAVQSIKKRIQSHDLSLQRLNQNISTEVEKNDGRLQSMLQQVREIYQLVKKLVIQRIIDTHRTSFYCSSHL